MTRPHRNRLSGATELLGDTVAGTTTIVQRMHDWVAGLAYAPIKRVPGVGPVAGEIEAVHRWTASRVYDAVRLSARGLLGAASSALRGWRP